MWAPSPGAVHTILIHSPRSDYEFYFCWQRQQLAVVIVEWSKGSSPAYQTARTSYTRPIDVILPAHSGQMKSNIWI